MVKKPKNKTEFVDSSFEFRPSLLWSIVGNLSEGLHNNKCTRCKFYLDYMSNKDDRLILRYFECKKKKKKDFNKDLIKRLANIYEFCDGGI